MTFKVVAVLLAKVREERVTSAAVTCAIVKGINVLRTKTALNIRTYVSHRLMYSAIADKLLKAGLSVSTVYL